MHSIMSDEQYAMTRYLDVVGSNPIPANHDVKSKYIRSLIIYYNKIIVVSKLKKKEGLNPFLEFSFKLKISSIPYNFITNTKYRSMIICY